MADITTTTQTASILVTDVVGSTELRARIGEDRAEELRREHDRLLTEAVTKHGGTTVKGMGDGVLAMFPGAAEAVAAAVDAQRAAHAHTRRNPDEPLVLRAGLSAGDVTVESGDCFGTPVIQASRLCAAAEGGQILAADVVRWLAGGRGEHRFDAVGAIELKGLPEPVPTSTVVWEPSSASTGSVPLPPILAGRPVFAFAGRDDAWQTLKSAWVAASHGERQVVLVAGEPGIGKTRLCSELAHVAVEDGGIVLYGGCDDDVDLPYRPFAQALGHLARHLPAEVVAAHAEVHGGTARVLAPSIVADAASSSGDPEIDRLRLFDAALDLLGRASASTPVLLILDDLHWADGSTLRLLRHVVRERPDLALLMVGTYRDTDVDRNHPLAPVLADLRREPTVLRIALEGLDAAAISDILTRSAGHELEADLEWLAAQLRAETDGNPFFVGEVMRHLIESGVVFQSNGYWTSNRDLLERVGVPEGVRDVIGRRLSALSEALSDVLRVAAVVGHEFDAGVVASVAGMDVGDVLDHLDVATRRGLIAEAGRVARFRFSHALVRQTLAEELSLGKRLRMHHQVAEALEAAGADVVAVAHHYCAAAVIADADKAVALARRAADEATDTMAWEQAARWYRRAIEAAESAPPSPELTAELLVALGEAMNASGDTPGARAHFVAAADHAEVAGRADLLTAAALGYGGLAAFWLDPTDQTGLELIARAEALLPDGDSRLRVDLLCKRSFWLTYTFESGLRAAVAGEALSMARRLDDASAVMPALWSMCDAMRGDPRPSEVIRIADELASLAVAHRDTTAQVQGHMARALALVVLGDADGVEQVAAEVGELGERTRNAFAKWEAVAERAGVASARGTPDAVELAEEGRRLGLPLGPAGDMVADLQQVIAPQLALGDDASYVERVGALYRRYPEVFSALHDLDPLAAAISGDRDEATRLLRALVEELEQSPAGFRAVGATGLARIALLVRDRDSASVLRAILAPWSGMFVTSATEAWGRAADHALADLDVAEGKLDDAVEHLRRAIELYERNGLLLALRATVELVEVLVERRAPGDLDEVSRLAAAIEPRLADRGFDHLAARLRAALP